MSDDPTVLEGLVADLRALRAFLNGQGELDGLSFGDPKGVSHGFIKRYWWREQMRLVLDQVASALLSLEGERDKLLAANERLGRLGRIVEGERDEAICSVEAAESALQSSQAQVRGLVGALSGIADDYMTSEHHHPGYVLIPTAKFEALRSYEAVGEGSCSSSGRPDGGSTGAGGEDVPSGPWRHPWCQPGDEPNRVFILRFCDQDMREMVFTDADAEADAWAAWETYSPAWNVYLFATLPRTAAPPQTPPPADVRASASLKEPEGSFQAEPPPPTSEPVPSAGGELKPCPLCGGDKIAGPYYDTREGLAYFTCISAPGRSCGTVYGRSTAGPLPNPPSDAGNGG